MNATTILIALLILAVFIAIIARGVSNKRKGKSGCACGTGCGSCPGSGLCHPEKSPHK